MIQFALSLGNFDHASNPTMDGYIETITACSDAGFGVELPPAWNKTFATTDPEVRALLSSIVDPGNGLSFHASIGNTWEDHRLQIDAIAELGGSAIVVHPKVFMRAESYARLLAEEARANSVMEVIRARHRRTPSDFDWDLARRVVEYAQDHGVTICYENGIEPVPFDEIQVAIGEVPGLGICFDTGHLDGPWDPYPVSEPLPTFLRLFRDRIAHLHLHDAKRQTLKGDHLVPGTGSIKPSHWKLLGDTLRELDYVGMAVFELKAKPALQSAHDALTFIRPILTP